MTYNIISTGSKGNAVVINGRILIDCGVPFKALEPVKKDLRLVLLTHIHSDHFNPGRRGHFQKSAPPSDGGAASGWSGRCWRPGWTSAELM